jgi:hypothetical protein
MDMQAPSLNLRKFESRLVLLGASNLTLSFPWVVKLAQGLWGDSIEILAALGYGRSYGMQSRVLGRVLPGILQSGLWVQLEKDGLKPTSAIVTDIGNDILYDAPVPQILDWVTECVRRLQSVRAKIVLVDLPLANLAYLPEWRFTLCRSILVPSCCLSLAEVAWRARAVSKGLAHLAAETGAVLVIPRPEWYGFDPIHIRPSKWEAAWQSILEPGNQNVSFNSTPKAKVLDWVRFQLSLPEKQWLFKWEMRKPQPGLRMKGSRIWLY